jgi:hypothetical protein
LDVNQIDARSRTHDVTDGIGQRHGI